MWQKLRHATRTKLKGKPSIAFADLSPLAQFCDDGWNPGRLDPSILVQLEDSDSPLLDCFTTFEAAIHEDFSGKLPFANIEYFGVFSLSHKLLTHLRLADRTGKHLS